MLTEMLLYWLNACHVRSTTDHTSRIELTVQGLMSQSYEQPSMAECASNTLRKPSSTTPGTIILGGLSACICLLSITCLFKAVYENKVGHDYEVFKRLLLGLHDISCHHLLHIKSKTRCDLARKDCLN